MARVTGVLQGISGKVGDLVYVKIGGKTYVRARVKKRKKAMSPAVIASHERFGIAGKISQRIFMMSELRFFWEREKSKNSSCYNKIFKSIFPQTEIEKLPDRFELTPGFGFRLTRPSIALGQSGLLIDCDPIDEESGLKLKDAEYIMAAGVILLRNPIDETVPQYDVISFKSEKIELILHTLISIVILLSNVEGNKIRSYSEKKAFATFIALDKEGNPVQYSVTIGTPLFFSIRKVPKEKWLKIKLLKYNNVTFFLKKK